MPCTCTCTGTSTGTSRVRQTLQLGRRPPELRAAVSSTTELASAGHAKPRVQPAPTPPSPTRRGCLFVYILEKQKVHHKHGLPRPHILAPGYEPGGGIFRSHLGPGCSCRGVWWDRSLEAGVDSRLASAPIVAEGHRPPCRLCTNQGGPLYGFHRRVRLHDVLACLSTVLWLELLNGNHKRSTYSRRDTYLSSVSCRKSAVARSATEEQRRLRTRRPEAIEPQRRATQLKDMCLHAQRQAFAKNCGRDVSRPRVHVVHVLADVSSGSGMHRNCSLRRLRRYNFILLSPEIVES